MPREVESWYSLGLWIWTYKRGGNKGAHQTSGRSVIRLVHESDVIRGAAGVVFVVVVSREEASMNNKNVA